MANRILTSSGYHIEPDPLEGASMAEQEQPFPRFYFSSQEPQGRVFNSQEEMDQAGGASVWKKSPQEITEQQQQAQTAHMAGQQSTQTGQQDPPRQEPSPGTPPPDEAPSSTTRRR